MPSKLPKAFYDLTPEELRAGFSIPDLTEDAEDKPGERVQVNLSKFVVDKLVKAWLGKGDRPGTIKDVFERAARFWLVVFANARKEKDGFHFRESRTGQDIRWLADELDLEGSPSLKEAYIVRVGAHIAVCMLREAGASEENLMHEVAIAAERRGKRLGDEVVDRLKLAARVLSAPADATARDLKKGY